MSRECVQVCAMLICNIFNNKTFIQELQTFLFPQNAIWFKEFAIQRKTKKIPFPDEVETATIAIDKATIASLPF